MTATLNDGFTQTTATGGETTIDFDFLIYGKDDIAFYETDLSGVISLLVRGTDYSIADGELLDPAGGEIVLDVGVYPTGATAGHKFTCISDIAETRSSDFLQGGDFFAQTLNTNLDRLTRVTQQLRRDVDKKAGLSVDSTLTSVTFTDAPQDGYGLVWDGALGDFRNTTVPMAELEDAVSEAAADAAAAAASASTASTAASTATTQAGIATAAAASVSLPALGAADTVLQVNAGGTALEYGKIATLNIEDDAVTLAKLENGTQGDVLYYGASGAPTRLPAGTSGQYLQTLGAAANPAWATLSASGFANGGYASSRYYFGGIRNTGGGNFAVTANRLYFKPFVVGAAATFTKIGINVTTGAGNARLGIYNFADGVPTTLVLDCGTVSTASTGEKEITISQALSAGVYALGVVFDNTPNITYSSDESFTAHFVGSDTFTGNLNGGGYVAHTYGALPTPFGAVTYAAVSAVPVLWMRK